MTLSLEPPEPAENDDEVRLGIVKMTVSSRPSADDDGCHITITIDNPALQRFSVYSFSWSGRVFDEHTHFWSLSRPCSHAHAVFRQCSHSPQEIFVALLV